METKIVLPLVSVVVIGRNEAKNLPSCIKSIREMDYPQDRLEMIYVDTDSTDGSPDVARSLRIEVCEEHSDFPSPGLARNRGWQEAKFDIVHFVDGDIVIDPNYLTIAVACLGRDRVACVIGRLQERHASDNLITRILEYPWKMRQPGDVDAPGAGGTFLKSALVEVGGYRSDVSGGEETELGARLRDRGYRVLLIDHSMGTHDYGIRHVGGLWARYKNIGRSFARVLQLNPSSSIATERRAAMRALVQGCLAILGIAVVLLFGKWWILLGAPVLLALYVVVGYWKPLHFRRLRIAYFMMEYFFKPAIWMGMIQYALARTKLPQK
jgi:glycosyltransferase involved in cell wall biosynthesis